MSEIDRVIVISRHGKSLANHVRETAERGDCSGFTPEFMAMDCREIPLVPEAAEQIRRTQAWLRDEYFCKASKRRGFDHHFVSSMRRSRETGESLLPEANWIVDSRLDERHLGAIEMLSDRDRRRQYPLWAGEVAKDVLTAQPPGGDSLLDVLRKRTLPVVREWLSPQYKGTRMIAVGHSAKNRLLFMCLEGTSPTAFRWTLDARHYPHSRIYNCELREYVFYKGGGGRMRRVRAFEDLLWMSEWIEMPNLGVMHPELLELVEP